ncbi:MAG: hypothetical protein LBE80_06790, partial [Deltaproteobacteria bacterium]|nr:hypothetical protein [Deltaproteobacteria bacterium]
MNWAGLFKSTVIIGLVMTLVVLVSGLARGRAYLGPDIFTKTETSPQDLATVVGTLSPPPPPPKYMAKQELADLIGPRDLAEAEGDYFEIYQADGRPLLVKTSLDPQLQSQALKWVNSSGALKTALVVLEPTTGRILALAGSGSP